MDSTTESNTVESDYRLHFVLFCVVFPCCFFNIRYFPLGTIIIDLEKNRLKFQQLSSVVALEFCSTASVQAHAPRPTRMGKCILIPGHNRVCATVGSC